MIVGSEGREVEILVQSERVELGAILKIGDFFGIVASMYYKEDEKIGSKQKLMARAQIFGKLDNGRLRKLKRPVTPYEEVHMAEKDELESIVRCADPISIGTVLGTKARAFLNADEYDRHTAILASTGAGKSYAAANLLKEFVSLGLPVVIVDTHGEYHKLVGKLAEGKSFSMEVHTVKYKRQGCTQFKIPVSNLSAPDFRHFASLNDNQVTALEIILNRLYAKGVKGEINYSLKDILNECDLTIKRIVDNKETDIHEETAKALKRRISGLDIVFRDVFDTYGTDINKMVVPYQVTIIDTSMVSQGIKQSVVSYLSKKILQGRINKVNNIGEDVIDHGLLFVIEEAHNYAGSNLSHSCKYQLQRVASEGRKFGIGLCVISQKPSKIDEEILSQCNTGIYMHITNPRDKEHIRRSFESINDAIIADLDSLDVGECIIAGAMLNIPFIVCDVDKIHVSKERASKFGFERPKTIKVGGFDYV